MEIGGCDKGCGSREGGTDRKELLARPGAEQLEWLKNEWENGQVLKFMQGGGIEPVSL